MAWMKQIVEGPSMMGNLAEPGVLPTLLIFTLPVTCDGSSLFLTGINKASNARGLILKQLKVGCATPTPSLKKPGNFGLPCF